MLSGREQWALPQPLASRAQGGCFQGAAGCWGHRRHGGGCAPPRDLRGSLLPPCLHQPSVQPSCPPLAGSHPAVKPRAPFLPHTPHSWGLHQGVGQRLLGPSHAHVVLPGCARPRHTRVWARIWKAASQGASPGLGTRRRSPGVRVEPPSVPPTWERSQLHSGCPG